MFTVFLLKNWIFRSGKNTEESEDSGLTSEERDSIIQKAQSFSENFQEQ